MINTVKIPARFVTVAGRYYDGSEDSLYAVSSTGGLTTGTDCPVTDYTDLEDRDAKWYYSLWLGLSVGVGRAARSASKLSAYSPGSTDDYQTLTEFEGWVDSILEKLEAEYPGLEDWSGE